MSINYEGQDDPVGGIESVIRRVLNNEVSTFYPAIIQSARPSELNPNVYVCDCFSSFLKVDSVTGVPEVRTIQNVPIQLPGRTNTFMVRPPMDPLSLVGASVGLVVSNNYLANWKNTGGTVLPKSARKFYYADAVALLGIYPDLDGWTTPPKVATAQIKVKTPTYLEIGNDTADLLRMMQDLISIVTQADSMGGTLAGVSSLIRPSENLVTLASKILTLANPDETP